MDDQIRGEVYYWSEVQTGINWEDKSVVELRFTSQITDKTYNSSVVVVDRATAARLINQLRRALDK